MATSRMLGETDPRRVVAEGYDRIAERYAGWAAREGADGPRSGYAALVLERLPQGASVVELGWGGGGAPPRQLAERLELTGVDVSDRQVELARQNVPGAT